MEACGLRRCWATFSLVQETLVTAGETDRVHADADHEPQLANEQRVDEAPAK